MSTALQPVADLQSAPATRSATRPATRPAILDESRFAPGAQYSLTAHRIYEQLIALWAPAVIEAGHDLGVFAQLAQGPSTSAGLAQALGTDPRATRVLLDALSAFGMLERLEQPGPVRFVLPDDVAACVLPEGIFSLAGKIAYDRAVAWAAWQGLAGAVRAGTTGTGGEECLNQISEREYENLVGGINFWAPPIVHILARHLHERGWSHGDGRAVLDVGCGTGIYSHLLLQQFPFATAVGLDAERIAPIARRQSRLLGVADRFTPRPGDFAHDPWSEGSDLVLFANIFHLQHRDAAQELLRRAARSLAPGGVVAIVDHIVDEARAGDSVQDRFARLFAASMLATGGGDAYTLGDYGAWTAAAGLRRVALLDAPMHRVLIAELAGADRGEA
jgi:SAM-dependent methyltransferase